MRILFGIIFCFLSIVSFGQKKEIGKAITTEGRRIILYDDGSWKYELEPVPVMKGSSVPDTAEDLYSKPVGGAVPKKPV